MGLRLWTEPEKGAGHHLLSVAGWGPDARHIKTGWALDFMHALPYITAVFRARRGAAGNDPVFQGV